MISLGSRPPRKKHQPESRHKLQKFTVKRIEFERTSKFTPENPLEKLLCDTDFGSSSTDFSDVAIVAVSSMSLFMLVLEPLTSEVNYPIDELFHFFLKLDRLSQDDSSTSLGIVNLTASLPNWCRRLDSSFRVQKADFNNVVVKRLSRLERPSTSYAFRDNWLDSIETFSVSFESQPSLSLSRSSCRVMKLTLCTVLRFVIPVSAIGVANDAIFFVGLTRLSLKITSSYVTAFTASNWAGSHP